MNQLVKILFLFVMLGYLIGALEGQMSKADGDLFQIGAVLQIEQQFDCVKNDVFANSFILEEDKSEFHKIVLFPILYILEKKCLQKHIITSLPFITNLLKVFIRESDNSPPDY